MACGRLVCLTLLLPVLVAMFDALGNVICRKEPLNLWK